ncbi:hypothetical protein BGZ73_000349, partial [Actinomortierella ambigua]
MLRELCTLRASLAKLKDLMDRENDVAYNKAPWLHDSEWVAVQVLLECLQPFKSIAKAISTSPQDSILEDAPRSDPGIMTYTGDNTCETDDSEAIDGSDVDDSDVEQDGAAEEGDRDGDWYNSHNGSDEAGSSDADDVLTLHQGLAANTLAIRWLALKLLEDLKEDLPVPEDIVLGVSYKQAFDRLLNTLAEKIEERIEVTDRVVAMAFLHPAHVNLPYISNDLREERDGARKVYHPWEHILREECREISSNQGHASMTNTRYSQSLKRQPIDRVEKIMMRQKEAEYNAFKDKVEAPDGIVEEIARYRKEAGYDSIHHPRDIEPFSWWAKHKQNFPTLARVAQKHLSIAASSVVSERLFRHTEDQIAKRRTRLSSKAIDAMVVVQFASKCLTDFGVDAVGDREKWKN